MITNLMDVGLQLFDVNGEIVLNFLEKFIGILIGAVGITGLGIILYCLILKVVILPLDIWQKATMRKQSLKMKSMRGQLEVLQQQYANSPELYQKKINEVYKQNNYNLFSSCIPMLATLVILIFAFQSLTGYSQHMNLAIYTNMATSYNQAIQEHCGDDAVKTDYEKDGNYYKFQSADERNYVYYIQLKEGNAKKEYYVDIDRLMKIENSLKTDEDCIEYVTNIGREAAAESYKREKDGLGWIKNIYYPDVAWAHPLQSYSDFCSAITRDITKEDGSKVKIRDFINENIYNEITYNLSDAKKEPNGYFILVILTILTNLGSQFIMMRSQKDQRELQTADKSAQSMQKWMMFLMPVMFCVFAFIYSAAFSLYLITSSLFSLLSTLIVNKCIDAAFNKNQEKQEKVQVQYGGRKALTRDWEKNKEIMNVKENKKDDKNKKDNKKR